MSETENTQQQPKTILAEFSNNITLITVGVLSIAYLNQLIYYSFFSIPIYNYIQVGELITLFVPALFNYLFQGLLPIAIIYFLLRTVNHIEKSKTVYNTNSNREDSLGITTTINSIKSIKSLYSINSLEGINMFRTIINFFQAIGETIIIIIESVYKTMLLLFLVGCLFFIYKIFDDDKVLYSQNHSKEFFDGARVQAVFCTTAILVVLEYLNIFVLKIPNNKFRLLSRYTLYLISPILLL